LTDRSITAVLPATHRAAPDEITMTTDAQSTRCDLPLQPTPLIGRDAERDAVLSALTHDDVRLVSLTGPGGIGKTSLALDVAMRVRSAFPDGLVFVSLAAIREPELVLPTIAQAAGIRESANLTPRTSLEEALRSKHILVILDNFEHLLAAAPDIAWLLATCANLKVLATSRARLQIRGEHELAVLPLPLPDSQDPDDLTNPAMALFAERAREIEPAFNLDPVTTPVVAEICRRLDGIPLAIELAAARVKVLPPSALLARLDRRLPLLTGGARDLPDRLRTMRDAIGWSYDLLEAAEQSLFRQLSVFTGGFTLHEAQSLVEEDDAEPAVLEGLAGLVDASLVRQLEREGEPRFLILETIREFGLEQLSIQGEADLVQSRHADLFLTFAEAATPRLRGAERTAWLERLEQAHPNLRAALAWSLEQHDAERGLRLAGALWQFWWWRSHLGEGRQWLDRALALPDAGAYPVPRARALTGSGALAETQGEYAVAEAYHDRAEAAWQETGDTRGLAISLLFRWLVSFNADDQQRMNALAAESLRLFREIDDPWGIAMSLMEQGVMAMRRQDHAAAEEILTEGIARFEAINDQWGIAICKGVLANVATDTGDYPRSAALLSESLTTLLLLDDLWGVATVLPAAARMAAEQGEYAWAVRISGAIARMHETMGALLKAPFRVRFEQTLTEAKTVLGEERFAEALAEGQAMSPEQAVQEAIRPIATVSASEAGDVRRPAVIATTLSPREREVLRLVPECTAREIGAELFISESTVRTHIENILNKLGLRNQKELIAYVYQHGLV
jgi:predicted ATPase/DNA-binding CsgD family transcriptional regulator